MTQVVAKTLAKIAGEALSNPEGVIKEKQHQLNALGKTLEEITPAAQKV